MFQHLHRSVFLNKVFDVVKKYEKKKIIDFTFGCGGHSERLLNYYRMEKVKDHQVIGIDRDVNCEKYADNLMRKYENFQFHHQRFGDVKLLEKLPHNSFDCCLFDFGCNSIQLNDVNRGFSFQHSFDAPLDMRFDGSGRTMSPNITAADILNYFDEDSLIEIFRKYGEEKRSELAAKLIVDWRKKNKRKYRIVADLLDSLKSLNKYESRIHFATKIFQSLRIFVNNELEEMSTGLKIADKLLERNGLLICITFHSLEDRIVKFHMKQNKMYRRIAYELKANEEDIKDNVKCRSAKFRIGERK
ncbi:hypothetical protein SNEBB_010525 [Seison nebaliae]|nr:hypothetical protein SNEBB_010525 [Seison nebaliae]